jgi:type IV pilus assembly protein PilC
MPSYKYTARNKEGKIEDGFIDVQGEDQLITSLQSQGLTVISFRQGDKASKASVKSPKKKKMHSGVKLDDLIALSKQLQALLSAGITMLRSLEIVNIQMESKQLFDAVDTIKNDVSSGSSLKAAIAKHPKIFSHLWVNIIETGETTGQLPFALEQLVTYLESSSSLQRKIKSALVYPIIVLCVASAAIAVFIVKIIPMFAEIYEGLGSTLPPFTQAVFDVCMGIKQYLFLIVGIVAAFIVGIRYYRKNPDGRRQIDNFILNLPLLGEATRQVSAVRFASGLNMLIKSGTPILHALDIVIETSGNFIVKDMLVVVKENVREGKPMSEPLLKSGIFPEMLSHMVAVGEESGSLASMLDNAAKFYEERVDATISRLAVMFEPILIVVIGIIVGTLVIAMFLPIFGLTAAMTG